MTLGAMTGQPKASSRRGSAAERWRAFLDTLPPGGCELDVSILFADVRGSTALAERLTPTAFSQLMRGFYRLASDVVGTFDGSIDRLVGDGVVALFIPGVAGPEHARRAIDAAHALLVALDRDADGSPRPPVGIGVHTGIAWLGPVPRFDGRVDFTALGDAVNVTAHLCEAAGPGEVAISEQAFRAAGRFHPAPPPRPVQLKRRRTRVAARFCGVPNSPGGTQSCFGAGDGSSKSLRYSPYPSASSFSTGMKRSAAELMQ
jgi:adenylate cyclase